MKYLRTLEVLAGLVAIACAPLASAQWLTNGSTLYTNSGRVGILQPNPNEALEVRGSIQLANGLAPAYLRLASAFTYLWFEPIGTTFGSAFVQAGTNNNFSASGNYFGFHVPVGRQFLFDADIVIQNGISGSSRWQMGLDGTTTFRIKDETNGIRMQIAANGDTTFNGSVTGTNIRAQYQDIAEWVPATEPLEPGTVVAIDAVNSNHVTAVGRSYDTSVAGVISLQPGITLGEPGAGRVLVATTGRVRVKVDATKRPIKRGDLLVSSGNAGVAMASEPVDLGGVAVHRPGTVIGKALEPLASGTGEILVLLSLQ